MVRDASIAPISPGVRSSGRVPPSSEDAERGVLGSILLDASRVVDLAVDNQLIPEAFYVPRHQIIFEAVITLYQANAAIDVLTLGETLKTTDQLAAVGGLAYLDEVVDFTPTAAHAEYYIDIVRQKHLLRSIIAAARDAETACYGDDNADLLLSKVEQDFLDITERQHGSITVWSDAIKEVMLHVEQVFQTKKGIGGGISSGFHNIDRVMSGLRPGEMIVLAARPSMGKTSLAMNIAENVALGKLDPDGTHHGVGMFSLEMSYESLVMRMLCCRAEVSGFHMQKGYLSPDLHRKLVNAAASLIKAPIYIDDTGGLDVMELRARARRMKKKHDIKLIVIDYLQLLNCREYSKQGRQLETSAISSGIKAMAKELKVPVIVLSQLSRAPEQRDKEGKPKLSDLRDSGAIEQDADVVMMLRRPSYYPGSEGSEDERLSVVDVCKQRNGPTGDILLNFDRDYTRFSDRVEREFHGNGDEDESEVLT